MKLFTIRNLPIYYQHGKSSRKLTMNAVLSMQWQRRKRLHDDILRVMELKFANIPPVAVCGDDHYRVSFGFWRDAKTGNVDIDNFSYIGKVCIDALAKKLGINDSIHRIIEVRYCYLGQRDTEELVMQVEKIDTVVVETKLNKHPKKEVTVEEVYRDSWRDV